MAIEAGFVGLNMYMGISPQSQSFNHGKDLTTIVKRARTLLEDLRHNYPSLILRFSGEDAFRTPLAEIYRVCGALVPLVGSARNARYGWDSLP